MRLTASASLLPELLGGPLVVLDRPPPPGPRALAAYWLDDAERLRATTGDADPAVALDGMPLGCIALIAFTTPGAQRLERLRAAWHAVAPASAPPLVDLSALNADMAIVLAIAEACASRLGEAMAEAGELTRQIVALRHEVERLATARRELAEAAPRAGCVFEAAPGAAAATPAGAQIRQRLPVSARGFVALDLHFAPGGAQAGLVEIELWRLEEDALLARFAVPATAARGWRRFALGEAADCAPGTVELRIQVPRDVRLSLTESRPGVAEPAEVEGAGALDAPLALRLYADTPGRPAPPAMPESDAALKARIAALENSTSWRITAPLRLAARIARRWR